MAKKKEVVDLPAEESVVVEGLDRLPKGARLLEADGDFLTYQMPDGSVYKKYLTEL